MSKLMSKNPVGSSKITGKYQITIPKEIRKAVRADLGSDVIFRVIDEEKIEIKILPPIPKCEDLAGSLKIPEEIKKEINTEKLTEGIGEYIVRENQEDVK